ncbi:MAG: O-antigen ligase family protein [Candidatus Eisenbacteria bacterium]|nr:O-antigen ligase family protein [Candidatus Eisenbacteria bacterium]
MKLEPAPLPEREPRGVSLVRPRQLILPATLLATVAAGFALMYYPPEIVLAAVMALLLGVVLLSRPFVGLLILLGIMVVQPGELELALAALHIERIAAAMVILATAYELRQKRTAVFFIGHPLLTAMYLFLLVLCLSMLGSVWLGGTSATIQAYVRTLAYCLIIINLVRSPQRLATLMRFFMLLHTYLAFQTLKGYYAGEIVLAQGISRAVGKTSFGGDPNTLAATLIAAIPIFFLGFRVERSWGWRVVWGASMLACLWTVVLTGSRSGILGVLLLAVLLWIMSPRKLVTLMAALALLGVVWLAMPQQYKTRYLTIKNKELDESSQGRIEAWKAGIQMYLDRPLLGVGAGNFSPAHAMQAKEFEGKNWLQAHSLYIQLIAELGTLGALAFLYFLFRMFQNCARLIRKFPVHRRDSDYRGVVARSALIACLALMLVGIFGHNLYRITWYLMAGLLIVVDRAQEA